MEEAPHEVLSEHFQDRMEGRRLRSAIFLTYQFDPGFFEQEVLPVLVDIPLSHAAPIRLVQLEDALRALKGHIAVYYDANGLVFSDAGSAKLDVRRIPVQHRGIFHPKNVFLLVEENVEDGSEPRAQTLIIASMSANLTQAGWWENVEACHVEEIAEGDKSRLKDDLAGFLEGLRRKTSAEAEHLALRDILAFLRSAEQRQQKTAAGMLHTHFCGAREPFVEFLERTAGDRIRGAYLEIISPYFDDAVTCEPLETLIKNFGPREVRVYLPRSSAGEAQCRPELYKSVRAIPGVKWAKFPEKIRRLGKGKDAGARFVHAKVYRFFTQSPKREICFVGSHNLTQPAHLSGGNIETGFLVETAPSHHLDFWMAPDQRKPLEFQVRTEDEASAASGGTRLNLRYHWDQERAEAFWDAPEHSPTLRLEGRGVELGAITPLQPRQWTTTAAEISQQVGDILRETSLVYVHGDGERPSLLLIQEEGMSQKPSLLFQLSAADILRYWSLLTPAQRSAFLEARASELALSGPGADLISRAKITLDIDTIFDRFAGIFHAFACLERAVRTALGANQDKESTYRLFGKKYDSLGSLLDRVASEQSQLDNIDRYVIVMCAKQTCQEIAEDYADFWKAHANDARCLEARFTLLTELREQLIAANSDGFGDFLNWFDRWFLRRAEPAEVDL